MAFREKSAWITVLGTLPVWIWYFWQAVASALSGTLDGNHLFWLFVWCLGATFAIKMPLHIAAAMLARQEIDAPLDERERAIDDRAQRTGLAIVDSLGIGLVLASGLLADFARQSYADDPAGAATVLLVNGILMALALSAFAREIVHIVHFRMMDR